MKDALEIHFPRRAPRYRCDHEWEQQWTASPGGMFLDYWVCAKCDTVRDDTT